MEEWIEMTKYKGYSISSFGNVRNDKTGRILKLNDDSRGYLFVNITKKYPNLKIHRLVGIHFLPNPENKPIIDHIDRNTKNNNVSNLRWVSISQNQQNSKKRINTTSKYKGVNFIKSRNRWFCRIKVGENYIYLGQYKTELEGAIAYNKYIIEKGLQEYFVLNDAPSTT